jgi:hypothetical protein
MSYMENVIKNVENHFKLSFSIYISIFVATHEYQNKKKKMISNICTKTRDIMTHTNTYSCVKSPVISKTLFVFPLSPPLTNATSFFTVANVA